MYPILKLGNLKVPMYALCIFVGAVLFLITFFTQLKKLKVRIYFGAFILTFIAGIVLFIVGASLWDNTVHALDGSREFGSAGISFLGGAVLGLGAYALLLFLVYQDSMAMRIIFHALVPSLLIAHAFGRLGCFFGGCCYGKPSSWFWGVVYPEGSVAAEMYGYGTKLIPTQLIESVYLLGLYFLFLFVFKKRRVMLYCVCYGIYRFFAEYLRGDSRGAITSWLSPSQFLSIILLIVAAVLLILSIRNKDDGRLPEPGYIIKSKLKLGGGIFVTKEEKEEMKQEEEEQ